MRIGANRSGSDRTGSNRIEPERIGASRNESERIGANRGNLESCIETKKLLNLILEIGHLRQWKNPIIRGPLAQSTLDHSSSPCPLPFAFLAFPSPIALSCSLSLLSPLPPRDPSSCLVAPCTLPAPSLQPPRTHLEVVSWSPELLFH